MCHDRGFHLYRPAPRPSPTELRGLLPDAGRQLWLLFHSSLGVLLLHLHQRPHVHDPEEAQIGFRSPATLPTVWHTRSCNHFVYNHFFVVFLANILFPLKAFIKKEEKRESFGILGIRDQTTKAGIQNASPPKVSARPSKIQQCGNPQDASHPWTWGGVWPKAGKACLGERLSVDSCPAPSTLTTTGGMIRGPSEGSLSSDINP